MTRFLTAALAAALALVAGGPARAIESNQVVVETTVVGPRPVRNAISLARPAGRAAVGAARVAGKTAVVAGKAAKPLRRAAWLGRAVGKGAKSAGKVAAGVHRFAKKKPLRLFQKKVVVPVKP